MQIPGYRGQSWKKRRKKAESEVDLELQTILGHHYSQPFLIPTIITGLVTST